MSGLSFVYSQLDCLQKEFRLLTILPGDDGMPMVCTLAASSINDCPAYDALSYTWGLQHPLSEININDASFMVGPNLYNALNDLRKPDDPVRIWVDAICINQQDIPERGRQVQMMTDIYDRAQTVHAWIDREISGAEEAAFIELKRLEKRSDVAKHTDAFWQPVKQIFTNPYFSRLWIQQELIMAKHAEVHFRRFVVELTQLKMIWDDMRDSILERKSPFGDVSLPKQQDPKNIREPGAEKAPEETETHIAGSIHLFGHLGLERTPPGIKLLEEPGKRRWDFSSTSSLGLLLESVNAAGDLKMTDQRDQVYGVLGLAHDVHPGDVTVDYSLSLPQVYAKVCRHHIAKYSELSFLGFWLKNPEWLTKEGIESQKDIPSWQKGIARGFAIRWGEMSSSAAAGCTTASHAEISQDGRILSVRGIMVDTIRARDGHNKTVERVPIVELVTSLTHMSKTIWPDFREGTLLDRQEIVSLFYPWFDEHRYSVGALGLGEKPSPGQKRWILSQIVVRALKEAMLGGSQEISLMDQLIRPTLFPDVPIDYLILWLRLIVMGIANSFYFTTTGGRIGRASYNVPLMQEGDQVWILFGFTLPVVLRPSPDDPTSFKVVGPAIIPGLMDGEACTNITASGEPNDEYSGPEIRSIHLI